MKKLIFSILVTILCTSCAFRHNSNVYTNQFYQNNYSTEKCYDGTKTFSQIIVCLQEVDKKEKSQNEITNKMIDNEK
jgi:hypothetical protein